MLALASPEVLAAVTITGTAVGGIALSTVLGLHRRVNAETLSMIALTGLVIGLLAALVASGALKHW